MLEADGEFGDIRGGCDGIELADSITGDAHKLLNVVSLSSK
jgi:glutamate/tyrosine decarboxylase-like PLP-dependent enzyme